MRRVTVHYGLSAVSPQEVSKRPTTANHSETQKARSAGASIDCQQWPSMRRSSWVITSALRMLTARWA